MRGQKELYEVFEKLNIEFEYYEHPPVPTVEEAIKYWKGMDATKCKNLFFRNHSFHQKQISNECNYKANKPCILVKLT